MNPTEDKELREKQEALAAQIRDVATQRGITELEAIEWYIQRLMEKGEFETADFMARVRDEATDALERIDDVFRPLKREADEADGANHRREREPPGG